ncbi:CcoH-like protein [Pseudoalteromonas sp. NBT06-2]|uniref:FixH family protein n=1 Tax=Pseudoalteromonas sp. NBT06-2 TaxID=2025950 RepID=UPI000BA576DC|nr:FixH family protein [Pseudoalteromonas sp. NBT06-2]PAJ72822.1 CcoH-like protein [Pseudoalteromonas sp. NBT06-2]
MTKTLPWYKQFWPWFIIFIPFATVVACSIFVYIAFTNTPDMVVDDYYKKGKAINLDLAKFDKAKALYLHGDLKINDDTVSFKFTKGDNNNVPSLKVSFYHTTIKAHDFTLMLTKNGNGEFTALTDKIIDGRFNIFIEPFDSVWKLKETIKLPYDKAFKISPQYNKK